MSIFIHTYVQTYITTYSYIHTIYIYISLDIFIYTYVQLHTHIFIQYIYIHQFGHIRDFFGAITGISRYKVTPKKGYANLFKSWESFFTRRLFHRLQDCWNRPICSNPGAYIDVMERTSSDGSCTLQTNGSYLRCLNLGSYNYLGFADDWKNTCSKVSL